MKPLLIAGSGAVAATGTRSWQVATTLEAGLSRVQKLARGAHALWANPCRSLPQTVRVETRLFAALASAIEEALAGLAGESRRRVLYLALPSPSLGWPANLAERMRPMLDELCRQLLISQWLYVCEGAAGGFSAAAAAFERLQAEPESVAVIAGADNWLEPVVLQRAFDAGWLVTDTDDSGFIAGEAAAAVALCAVAEPHRQRRQALLHRPVCSHSTGRHPPPQGELGEYARWAETLRRAITEAGLRGEHLSDSWSDQDGDLWRVQTERAALDAAQIPTSQVELRRPGALLGNVGAAWAPLLWTLVTEQIRNQPLPPGAALTTAASLGGSLIGAAVIERSALPPEAALD